MRFDKPLGDRDLKFIAKNYKDDDDLVDGLISNYEDRLDEIDKLKDEIDMLEREIKVAIDNITVSCPRCAEYFTLTQEKLFEYLKDNPLCDLCEEEESEENNK